MRGKQVCPRQLPRTSDSQSSSRNMNLNTADEKQSVLADTSEVTSHGEATGSEMKTKIDATEERAAPCIKQEPAKVPEWDPTSGDSMSSAHTTVKSEISEAAHSTPTGVVIKIERTEEHCESSSHLSSNIRQGQHWSQTAMGEETTQDMEESLDQQSSSSAGIVVKLESNVDSSGSDTDVSDASLEQDQHVSGRRRLGVCPSETKSGGVTGSSQKGQKPFSCNECDTKFSSLSSLKIHMRRHTGQKLHACDQCKATFTHSGHLKIHKRKHTGEKPYTCDQCQIAFSTPFCLKSHMRTHSGERPYKCDLCDATFAWQTSLKCHLQTHTKERPFACDQCDATFAWKFNLKKHMRIHNGEKPYSCDQCDASFAWHTTLKAHLQEHLGEKPYACDQCDMTFSWQSSLKSHMSKHSGKRSYACEQCYASFKRKISLKNHMRKHTGEMPFTCDQCGASFTWKVSLKNHMRKHSGEMPFTCEQCNATFTWEVSLRNHIRRHNVTDAQQTIQNSDETQKQTTPDSYSADKVTEVMCFKPL